MFSNLNWYNIAILLLLALFIFGDKLPQALADGLRMLRKLRRMAQSATTDLSRELGTEVQLEDLHPRTFVRKHLLSEADEEALLRPLKGVSDDVLRQARGVEADLKEVGRRTGGATGGTGSTGASRGGSAGATRPRRTGNGSAPPESASGPPEDRAAGDIAGRPNYDDVI